jgi:hypothetical protein
MATGFALPSIESVKGTGTASITTARTLAPWDGFDSSGPDAGALTNTQPIDEPALEVVGHLQPMFGFADWYERIHVNPQALDLGNVVGDQTRDVVVWNAYTTGPKTLASIDAQDAEGITVTQPSPAPLVFEPLRERTYTFNIGPDGPGTIDARYTFNFTGANDPVLPISGERVIPWTWLANWREGIVERLDWNTETLTAFDGTEQRIKLREFPRRAIEFSFSAEGRQRRRLDAALYGWGARVWALPIWTDGQRLAADVAPGALSIPVATTDRDFAAGVLVMLLDDAGGYEVVEVEAVEADSLTLVRPILGTWPAGSCMVYPARPARLPNAHGLRRFTGDFAYGRVRMELQDLSDWPAAAEATTYRGLPVMLERPNWTADPELDYARKLAELDFGTGVRAFDDESDKPELLQSMRWFLDSRADVGAFRSWLYARAGKFKAIWVPTWMVDLVMLSNLGSGGVAFDVENIGYTRHIDARVHRRDLRIQLASGAVYYRRITAAVEVDADTETLTIDSALGVAITPADVVSISFMALCRLDADGVEIAWFTGDVAQAATNLRATGNDA